MAQREGNVFLYAFIPTFVLLVGAIVVIFYQNAELESARDDYNELVAGVSRSEIRPVKKLLTDRKQTLGELDALREVVGGALSVNNWPGDEHFTNKLKDAESRYNEIASSLDLEERTFDSLESPYADLTDMIARLDEKWQAANEATQLTQDQINKIETLHKENLDKLDGELATLQTQYQGLQAQNEDAELASSKKISQLTTELEELREVVGENEIKYRNELAYKDNQNRNLSGQLTRLRLSLIHI